MMVWGEWSAADKSRGGGVDVMGGEEGDDDEVLVWCTRSSDGDGGEERRLSPESDRKRGAALEFYGEEREWLG
ncbi:hypothetical protein Tco_0512581 [Tanacetum coccineum]